MENNLVKYIVYITVNTVNGKFYIGVHRTETPLIFDGYIGCGAFIDKPSSYNKGKVPLHKAILKYGTKSFIRNTLAVFDSLEEALKLEALLVNEDFIKRPNTYNATVGGGAPPMLNREVYQYTIKGELVKVWESETDILKYYDSKVSITTIIKNKRSFAGYLWSFSNSINVEEYKLECNRGFISQYNLDGLLLEQFKNTTIAAQKLDMKREEITRAVFEKRPTGGYYFLKSDVDIVDVLNHKVENPKLKPVYRYLKSGEYDTYFKTTSEAVRNTIGAHTSSIRNAVINGNLCGGYRWSYIKDTNYFNIENPKEDTPTRKIAQYTKNGDLIKIWESAKECKKQFRYCLRVCNGTLKSTQNYIFKYYED